VDEVVAAHGRIDILVNNAGGTFFAPFLELSDKGEQTLVAENFTQVTRLIRLVVPHMPPGGAIVNLTSVEAHQAAPGFAVYAAMKAGLAQLTRTLALELASRKLRVNAVAPDAIPTEGDEQVRDTMLAGDPEFEPVYVPPVGAPGQPEDAAGVVVFLASRLAAFVTGVTVHVDGGTWAAGGWRRTDAPPA
ncbi:MAG TPA: SDR family oxidoreductase, partial [Acidimicrobiia bacterium]|nr:SDR family oxidoreductase [Acidimicrobiia bacterium]